MQGGDRKNMALVEHRSADTFSRTHAGAAASEVERRLHRVVEGGPVAEVYEVVEDADAAGCCGGQHGAVGHGAETVAVSGRGCCGGS